MALFGGEYQEVSSRRTARSRTCRTSSRTAHPHPAPERRVAALLELLRRTRARLACAGSSRTTQGTRGGRGASSRAQHPEGARTRRAARGGVRRRRLADRRSDDCAPVRVLHAPRCVTGVYRYGDRALLGMLGARPFALAEDPVPAPRTDKIAAQLGVRPPQLYLIDDGFPRLFAVGRGPMSSFPAVSLGAPGSLRRESLEAATSPTSSRTSADATCSRRPSSCSSPPRWSRPAASAAGSRGRLLYPSLRSAPRSSTSFSHRSASYRADALAASSTRAAHDLADALMRGSTARPSSSTSRHHPRRSRSTRSIRSRTRASRVRSRRTPSRRARLRRLRELGAGIERPGLDASLKLAGSSENIT